MGRVRAAVCRVAYLGGGLAETSRPAELSHVFPPSRGIRGIRDVMSHRAAHSLGFCGHSGRHCSHFCPRLLAGSVAREALRPRGAGPPKAPNNAFESQTETNDFGNAFRKGGRVFPLRESAYGTAGNIFIVEPGRPSRSRFAPRRVAAFAVPRRCGVGGAVPAVLPWAGLRPRGAPLAGLEAAVKCFSPDLLQTPAQDRFGPLLRPATYVGRVLPGIKRVK